MYRNEARGGGGGGGGGGGFAGWLPEWTASHTAQKAVIKKKRTGLDRAKNHCNSVFAALIQYQALAVFL